MSFGKKALSLSIIAIISGCVMLDLKVLYITSQILIGGGTVGLVISFFTIIMED